MQSVVKTGRKTLMGVTAAAFLLAGCTTVDQNTGMTNRSNTKTGALIGAAVGAGVGALTNKGDQARKNAMIGAGIGALAGAGIGNYMDRQQQEMRDKLAGSGVSIVRRGDDLILTMPSDVTFASGAAGIEPNFYPVLNDVAQILNHYPATYIDIIGHADSTGSASLNQGLSERRAEATAGYLVNKGVKSERIYVAGMGSNAPVADNATPAGRAQNRRVEILVRPMK